MDSTYSKFSFSYSIGLHAFLFLMIISLMNSKWVQFTNEKVNKKETTWIEVIPSKVDSFTQKKVVDSAIGKLAENASKDAFLGERTQIVEKEMIHEGSSIPQNKGSKVKKEITKDQNLPTKLALSQLGVKMDFQKIGKKETQSIIEEEEGSLTAQAAGEYVKGFEKGNETLLNTKEYVFFGYFKRVRTSLDKAWETSLKNQMNKYFKRGRQLASDTDYTTKLLVVLNPKGEITKIQILSNSGTQDLDDASVKAFNTAGPFPNPPTGLVDRNGEIKIRWDFVVRT